MAALAVLLLRSTDEPDVAVAALRSAHGAALRPRRGPQPAPALLLEAEGARLAAKGVADVLSGGGRPDVRALLEGFQKAGGRVLVSAAAWRERGYQDDALVPGAVLVGAEALADLAAEGLAIASF